MRLRSSLVPLGAVLLFAVASPLSGQSLVSGSLSGSVVSLAGRPITGLAITLVGGSGGERTVTVNTAGEFSLEALTPGDYSLRAEALGFRPAVVLGVRVVVGRTARLDLRLNPTAPPVTAIDTVRMGAAGASSAARFLMDGAWIDALPDDAGALQQLVGRVDGIDETMGIEGLPGSMTTVALDGSPLLRARHPGLLGTDSPSPFLRREAFSMISIGAEGLDVERLGAGGVLEGGGNTGPHGGGDHMVAGRWAGDPGWSSSELDFEAPGFASLWGEFASRFGGAADSTRFFVQGEGMRSRRLTPARLSPALAGTLPLGADALEVFAEPNFEEVISASGHARYDRDMRGGGRLQVRADGGHLERQWLGPEPGRLVYGGGIPETATDVSFSTAWSNPLGEAWTLELRAFGSRSDLRFSSFSDVGLPAPTTLTDPDASLGLLDGSTGAAARTDVGITPVFHFAGADRSLKVGLEARNARHALDHGFASNGLFRFTDAQSLIDGTGVFEQRTGSLESDFGIRKAGLFAQYSFSPQPGVLLSAGVRADRQWVGTDLAVPQEDWLERSGVDNSVYADKFDYLSGRVGLEWDPSGTGDTWLGLNASLGHGELDPWAYHELITTSEGQVVSRAQGAGLDWPTLPTGITSRTALTLVGPDNRLPRTARASATLSQRLTTGLRLVVTGVVRRTDFLMRRRDLNRTAFPLGTDAHGRSVYSELTQVGALAGTGGVGRFDSFDRVWALESDGWSEYRGATARLQYEDERVRLSASYTRSETTDNWIGASRGAPEARLDPGLPTEGWEEGVSDFDVPEQAAVFAQVRLGAAATISAAYRYRSGRPFTPGYRAGVDANGDGSAVNDVAFVPDSGALGALGSTWDCLRTQSGSFAVRNSCRAPDRQDLDVRLSVALGWGVSLEVDGLDLIEDQGGFVDDALLLLDPNGSIGTDGGTVTLPTRVNPDFGKVVVPFSRGRLVRVGLRIGVGR